MAEAQSLADRLTTARTARQGGFPCSVQVALDSLQPDDRAALQGALDTPYGDPSCVPNGVLATLLIEHGVPKRVSAQTVGRHRRHECNCRP